MHFITPGTYEMEKYIVSLNTMIQLYFISTKKRKKLWKFSNVKSGSWLKFNAIAIFIFSSQGLAYVLIIVVYKLPKDHSTYERLKNGCTPFRFWAKPEIYWFQNVILSC